MMLNTKLCSSAQLGEHSPTGVGALAFQLERLPTGPVHQSASFFVLLIERDEVVDPFGIGMAKAPDDEGFATGEFDENIGQKKLADDLDGRNLRDGNSFDIVAKPARVDEADAKWADHNASGKPERIVLGQPAGGKNFSLPHVRAFALAGSPTLRERR
jgi:hypothetical protein